MGSPSRRFRSSSSSSDGGCRDNEAEEIYCICRSSDVSRFMIGCDHCEDWFHGDCVNVTEKESKYIKKYYCAECRGKNPKLEVVYKSSYADKVDREKDRERDRGRDIEREKKKEKEKEDRDRERSKHKEKKKDRDRDRDRDKERERRKEREREERRKEKKRKRRQREREKEEEERRKHEKETEEAEASKARKKLLEDEAPPTPISSGVSSASANNSSSAPVVKTERTSSTESKSKKPADVSGVERIDSASSGCPSRSQQHPPPVRLPPKKAILKEQNYSEDEDDDNDDGDDAWEPSAMVVSKPAAGSSAGGSKAKEKAQAQAKKRARPPVAAATSKKRRTRRESTSEEETEPSVSAPIHCLGPGCMNSSRRGSKYCSDQCGINLASTRIYQTLPDRIREWNLTACEAERKNRKELESIRAKQMEVQTRLNQLMTDFETLERLIEKGKEQTINDNDEEEDETEMTVYCVTCGSDVQARTAIRHMERCYNKIESQTSFASKYKTQIEDARMFCDFFNRKEQTYCKRLMVLCPEHHPDPKIGDKEVCGYPISKELLGKPTQFCLRAKKHCQQHFCWEKLRRAEIDMERVRQWMKVDELIEQERQVKLAMSNRSGVLGLMLHSTYNHELDSRWHQERQRAAAAAAAAQHQQRKVMQAQMKYHNQKPAR